MGCESLYYNLYFIKGMKNYPQKRKHYWKLHQGEIHILDLSYDNVSCKELNSSWSYLAGNLT